ncbi:hypothetical protein ACOJBO_11045 [Rhizobium beringeri]
MIKSASPIRSSQPLIILAGNFEEAAPVAVRLRELGWSCVCSPDYRTFEQQARLLKPDLLLLDSGVSDAFLGDGKRRKAIEGIPAIHLVSAAADRAPAFAAGAVDCVVKPILLEELEHVHFNRGHIRLLRSSLHIPAV